MQTAKAQVTFKKNQNKTKKKQFKSCLPEFSPHIQQPLQTKAREKCLMVVGWQASYVHSKLKDLLRLVPPQKV